MFMVDFEHLEALLLSMVCCSVSFQNTLSKKPKNYLNCQNKFINQQENLPLWALKNMI